MFINPDGMTVAMRQATKNEQGSLSMSEVGFILLSAFFLAIPVGVKYLLAFQTKILVETLKKQEREVQRLAAQLEVVEREKVVMGRAVRQVENQRRQAHTRRERVEEELERTRRGAPEEQLIAV